MDDGAHPADFRRQDKIGAQQRHRHLGKVKIELNSRADEERAGQEFAKLPAVPYEMKCWQAENDQCDEKCGDHVGFIAAYGFAPMVALALATG